MTTKEYGESIVEKPGVVDGRIEIRQYLYVTAMVDHDVIDGAPAIRALDYLKELIENAHGLTPAEISDLKV